MKIHDKIRALLIAQALSLMHTVYVYRGTFDPFHNNHETICQWCLAQPSTSALVLHINYRPPSERDLKQPASWQHRFELVQAAQNNNKTHVSLHKLFQDTLCEIKNTYGVETKIIQVLGDDVLALTKDNSLISAYAIHQRDQQLEISKIDTTLLGKNRINIPLLLPSISSTNIRILLMDGNSRQISAMVPDSIIPLIKNCTDYSPLKLSIRLLKTKNIDISDSLTNSLEFTFGKEVTLSHEASRLQGLSGDTMLCVMNSKKEPIAVCKLFAKGIVPCQKEENGYNEFSSFVKTPSIFFVTDNALCMEFIKGNHPTSTDEFTRIGVAYKMLHEKSMHEKKSEYPNQNNTLNKKIIELCTKVTDSGLANNLTNAFETLRSDYLNTPRNACLLHGDAQPSNSLLTEEKVFFIDLGSENIWQDASRDVHQMVASIYWKAFKNGMTNDSQIILDKINAFLQGYEFEESSPASRLWSLYWRTRSLILAKEQPQLPLSKQIIDAYKHDFSHLKLFDEPTQMMTYRPLFWHTPKSNLCQICAPSHKQQPY